MRSSACRTWGMVSAPTCARSYGPCVDSPPSAPPEMVLAYRQRIREQRNHVIPPNAVNRLISTLGRPRSGQPKASDTWRARRLPAVPTPCPRHLVHPSIAAVRAQYQTPVTRTALLRATGVVAAVPAHSNGGRLAVDHVPPGTATNLFDIDGSATLPDRVLDVNSVRAHFTGKVASSRF